MGPDARILVFWMLSFKPTFSLSCFTFVKRFFRVSLVAQLVKNLPAMQETWVWFLGWEITWRRVRLHTPIFWPGEFHGLYSLWGLKELNTTEWLSLSFKIDWFGLLAVQGLSRVFSSTTIQKHQFFGAQPLYGLSLTSLCDYKKNHSLFIPKWTSNFTIQYIMGHFVHLAL